MDGNVVWVPGSNSAWSPWTTVINPPFGLSQLSSFLDTCSKTVLIKHKEFKDLPSCFFFLRLTYQIAYSMEKNAAQSLDSPIETTVRAEQMRNDGQAWTHSRAGAESGPTFPTQSPSLPSLCITAPPNKGATGHMWLFTLQWITFRWS